MQGLDDHRRGTRRAIGERRRRQLQPADSPLGAADLRPGVPDDRPRGRRPRRLPGDLPAGVPGPQGLQGPGEVLVVALPHRPQPVPRLDAPPTAHAGRADARGRRHRRTGGGAGAGRVDRDAGGAARAGPGGGAGDGDAPGRAAHRHHPEGVPRVDVPGDRRPAGVPIEYRQDAPLPGAERACGGSWKGAVCRRPTSAGTHDEHALHLRRRRDASSPISTTSSTPRPPRAVARHLECVRGLRRRGRGARRRAAGARRMDPAGAAAALHRRARARAGSPSRRRRAGRVCRRGRRSWRPRWPWPSAPRWPTCRCGATPPAGR